MEAYVEVIREDGSLERHRIEKDQITVGKSPTAGVPIPDGRDLEPEHLLIAPRGEGCDASLAWWFTEEPWRQSTGATQPRARDVMRLSALPAACRAVLTAPAPVSEAAVTIGGGNAAPAIAAAGSTPVTANAYAPTPELRIPLPRPRPYD